MSKSTELMEIHAALSPQKSKLVNLYHQILQENPPSRRPRPADLKKLAADEVKALLGFIKNPDQAAVRQRGAQLCQAGLDEAALLQWGQAVRKFCLTQLPEQLRLPVLDVLESYHQTVTRSYILAREISVVEEAESLLQETIAMQQLSQALSGTLQFDEILDFFFQTCTKVLGFDFVIFSLVDKDQQRVNAIAGVGVSQAHLKRASHPMDSADIMADIIRTGRTEIITGWDERFDSKNFEAESMAEWGMRLFTPITLRRENIGLVEVGFNKNVEAAIEDSQLRLLRAFIDQTALALDNAQRYQASRRATHRESLIKEITTKVRASTNLDTVLQTTVKELGDAFGGKRTYVHLVSPSNSHDQ
ncbi:MAG: GAF domain-containing protein [Anaerolineae bacterium]|nr:GAF domain-containing protein [Anaerolineae bacterium]